MAEELGSLGRTRRRPVQRRLRRRVLRLWWQRALCRARLLLNGLHLQSEKERLPTSEV